MARQEFVEIEDVGFDVDLDDAADMLSLLLHCADQHDAKRLRVGPLLITAKLVNPNWERIGDMPHYRVDAIEVDE